MFRRFWIVILFLLISLNAPQAEIIQSGDFATIHNILATADTETLVIFDVDDVLLRPKDQVLKVAHKKSLEAFKKELGQRAPKKTVQELDSRIMQQRVAEPVDPRFINMIRATQARGVRVLALTHMFAGTWGAIRSLAEWRTYDLQKLGYHFEHSWAGLKDTIFDTLEDRDPNHFPVFRAGVILTCRMDKGKVLKAFLDYAGAQPKKIIFLDDKRKNLHAVEETARQKGIAFLGIEYIPPEDGTHIPLNKKRATLQLQTLEKEKMWLSDAAADQILNANSRAEAA